MASKYENYAKKIYGDYGTSDVVSDAGYEPQQDVIMMPKSMPTGDSKYSLPKEPGTEKKGFWQSLGGVAKAITAPDVMANVNLPLLGIAEVIATKGKSQGDYALKMQDILKKNIKDKEDREQTARDRALNRQKAIVQLEEVTRNKKNREKTSEIAKNFDYGALVNKKIDPEMNATLREYYSANPDQLSDLIKQIGKGDASMSVAMWENIMSRDPSTIEHNQATLDDLLKGGILTQEEYNSYKAFNDENTSYKLKMKLAGIIETSAKERAKTGPMVDRQAAMLPGKIKEKYANIAPEVQKTEEIERTRGKAERSKKQELRSNQASLDFDRLKSAMSQTWRLKVDAMFSPKIPLEQESAIGRTIARGAATLGRKFQTADTDAIEAYDGQLTETAMSMMPIMTGSSRIIESIYQMVRRSLPDPLEGESRSGQKLEATLRNMFAARNAFMNSGINLDDYDDEDLQDPNSEISKELEAIYRRGAPLSEEDRRQADLLVEEIIGYIPSKELPPLRDKNDPQQIIRRRPKSEGQPASKPQGIPTVTNDAEFNALPSGSQFKDPQGNIRRKP
jgi:hypothetical protein